MSTDIDRTANEVHELIGLYFSGSTTLEQEVHLRVLLADTSLSGDDVEEARAVMGFLAAGHGDRVADTLRRHDRRWLPAIGAAASIAVLAAIGTGLMTNGNGSVAMAYCGGHRIDDTRKVMDIIETDLSEFGAAAADADVVIFGELQQMGLMSES